MRQNSWNIWKYFQCQFQLPILSYFKSRFIPFTAYSLHGCPRWGFWKLAPLPRGASDLTKAQTLLSSRAASPVTVSVSLETSGVRVEPPAAHCSSGRGTPPGRRKQNTPTPSLFQSTDKDAGTEGATGKVRKIGKRYRNHWGRNY